MYEQRGYDERVQDFKDFAFSKRWGSEQDPDTGMVLYRGQAGPGTIEFSYDPETHEVVNGSVRPIDICR